MVKTIIKEIIIALLVCLAVLLVLSVILYDFIPSNKIIPEPVEYQPSSEVEVEINATVDDHSNEIIKTYEITANDLENFKRTMFLMEKLEILNLRVNLIFMVSLI